MALNVSLTLYALDNITDPCQFEKLCNDLLFREGFKHLKPHGGMHDSGIDASIHVHEANTRIIFQYSTQKTFAAKIKETLQKLKENGERCEELHYVSNREISHSAGNSLVNFAKNEYNIQLKIYDREWMRIRLDNDSSDLRKKYLGVAPEKEYFVDYKAYWRTTNNGRPSYVVELLWLDESEVQILQTTITATPSSNLGTRFNELGARGAFNFPTALLLESIASVCKFHINTQVIDDDPVINKIEIRDSSPSKRDIDLQIETHRLVDTPNATTVVYLVNYVPGICDAIKEELDKEMTMEERAVFFEIAKHGGVKPGSTERKRAWRASDLTLSPTILNWSPDLQNMVDRTPPTPDTQTEC